MEELLIRIAEAVESQNSIPIWYIIIQMVLTLVPLITIIMFLLERFEKSRPYIQISIEPIRSTLACAVIRNTGNYPVEIMSINFSNEFIIQLPPRAQDHLNRLHTTNLRLFPGQYNVISFDVNTFNIINDFPIKTLVFKYKYKKLGNSKKQYNEETTTDFSSLAPMLVYISESDELKRSVEDLKNEVVKVHNSLIEISKKSDEWRGFISK